MLTLHHLNNSRSQRVLWLLEELEIDYQITLYERDPHTLLAPTSLKAIHPLGKSPVITDGDLSLAESAVILEYLNDVYGQRRFWPGDSPSSLWQCKYWLHYAEGSLMPFLLMTLVFQRIKAAPVPFFVRPVARGIANKALDSFVSPNLSSNLDYVERHLSKNEWFAGEQMSLADFQMSFPLEAALQRGASAKSHPHLAAWVARIHQRDAYQRALTKSGPYAYA